MVKATDESVKGRQGSVGIADKEGDYRIQIHTPTLPEREERAQENSDNGFVTGRKIKENIDGSEKLTRLQTLISWDVHAFITGINK